jgi:structural maintenance of chromosome 3 (chondroitin sulfate proteoglycan 6)
MADLVRSKTEIECLIEDFKQAGENGEQRRTTLGQELEELETRIEEATGRLSGLNDEFQACIATEREAKDT